MRTILFPTDLSEAANRAYLYALHFANRHGARIQTLHVYQKPEVRGASHLPSTLSEFYDTYDLYEFRNYHDSIPYLDKIAADNHFDQVEVSHALLEGRTIPTILEQAKSENADLIIMGTTGARGLKEIFLGSTTGEVMENAHCPVLAVPEKAVFDGVINDVVFAISHHDQGERDAFDQLLQLMKPFDAHIHGIHVDQSHTEFHNKRTEQWMSAYSGHPNVSFKVLEGFNVEGTIIDYLIDRNIDLLAMVTHKRNFLQELFNYSKTKAMSYHGDVPVLSFPQGGTA